MFGLPWLATINNRGFCVVLVVFEEVEDSSNFASFHSLIFLCRVDLVLVIQYTRGTLTTVPPFHT